MLWPVISDGSTCHPPVIEVAAPASDLGARKAIRTYRKMVSLRPVEADGELLEEVPRVSASSARKVSVGRIALRDPVRQSKVPELFLLLEHHW